MSKDKKYEYNLRPDEEKSVSAWVTRHGVDFEDQAPTPATIDVAGNRLKSYVKGKSAAELRQGAQMVVDKVKVATWSSHDRRIFTTTVALNVGLGIAGIAARAFFKRSH